MREVQKKNRRPPPTRSSSFQFRGCEPVRVRAVFLLGPRTSRPPDGGWCGGADVRQATTHAKRRTGRPRSQEKHHTHRGSQPEPRNGNYRTWSERAVRETRGRALTHKT